MKEMEISSTKAHLESMHIMKSNAIYVNITEIYGYLSVLGINFRVIPSLEDRNEHPELNEIAEIVLPLYRNCFTGSGTKSNSQTKCVRVESRTPMHM